METVALEPIDSLTITTLVDNLTDALLIDTGPAHRAMFGTTAEAAPFMAGGGTFDALRAEHGFSAVVSVERAGRTHRVLFDTGMTPDGMVENMRRLEVRPDEIETIVLSHGHFDHTGGLHGLVRKLGRANLPVLIHPEFWSRRRLAIPGRDPLEIPTTSRAALEGAGHEQTAILAYAAKFASALYGPFREAVDVEIVGGGDRRSYQEDPANLREAMEEIRADVAEGADLIMVKPALAYLDVIARARQEIDLPLAAYHVSGEYAMVKAAAERGWIDGPVVAMEHLTAIKRAGADLILTYFARDAAVALR